MTVRKVWNKSTSYGLLWKIVSSDVKFTQFLINCLKYKIIGTVLKQYLF